MPLLDVSKNVALDAIGGQNPATSITHVSLHTAEPNEIGSNEVDDSGIYARQVLTWNPAVEGEKSISNQPVFQVPASTTITHVGLWDAAMNGTFMGWAQVPSETFNQAGTYTITSLRLLLLDPE